MSQKPKVLHVITGLSTGGAERALFNILAAGLKNSTTTAVISLRDLGTFGDKILAIGIPVYTLNIKGSIPGPFAIWRLRELVAEFEPDIIQGWMYHGNLAAKLASMLAANRPSVLLNVRHCLYVLKDEKLTTRWVVRANALASSSASAIVYNSLLSRHQHETLGFSHHAGQRIPNGFDVARLKPDSAKRESVRHCFGFSDNVFVVGHVARLHPMKDHASFLRAAVLVAERFQHVHFMLIGKGITEENRSLTGIVPEKYRDRILFLGERKDVEDLMRSMDLFCLSSTSEAFPNVLGEAMSLGKPCVSTDVGDSRDIVGQTGLIVPPSDSEALADALAEMVSKPEEEIRLLGENARKKIVTNYDLQEIVRQYQDLYEKIFLERK